MHHHTTPLTRGPVDRRVPHRAAPHDRDEASDHSRGDHARSLSWSSAVNPPPPTTAAPGHRRMSTATIVLRDVGDDEDPGLGGGGSGEQVDRPIVVTPTRERDQPPPALSREPEQQHRGPSGRPDQAQGPRHPAMVTRSPSAKAPAPTQPQREPAAAPRGHGRAACTVTGFHCLRPIRSPCAVCGVSLQALRLPRRDRDVGASTRSGSPATNRYSTLRRRLTSPDLLARAGCGCRSARRRTAWSRRRAPRTS